MTPTIILAAMLRFGGYSGDGDYTAHLRPVSEAIAEAAGSREEAAALIAQGWHESRFARYVVEGRCLDGPVGARCDPDRDGRPRARGPWQVWAWCRPAWALPEGSPESLRAEARCVVGWMRGAMRKCGGQWEHAFAGMTGSSRCDVPWAARRLATMVRVRDFLYLLTTG